MVGEEESRKSHSSKTGKNEQAGERVRSKQKKIEIEKAS